jgi:flagellar motility protein MotE (MotC chaperone)
MARKDENLSPDAPEMQLKQLRESQKAFKKEQKNQRKEAKKRAKELENQERELDEQIDGTNASVVVVTLFIIVIWLGILCLLVKMDVGGFGSNVLTPMLKDIPVINKILPTENGLESPKEKAYGGYNSIKDAVDYASELEKKLEQAQSTNTAYSEQIEVLKAEVKRLQTFEDNQVNFQRIKEQFYEEVVYADNGPGAEEYRAYYEEMDPTTAEALYKQVIQEEAVNNKMKDYVATYSNMDAKKAAGILGAMTDNLDLAANILMNLPASTRGAIMGEMDAAVAARISRIMNPGN